VLTEDYVRPPLVGAERRSDRLAAWRFRLVLLVLLAAIVAGLVFVYLALTGSGDTNPGITPGA
jgi:hypothetical protein